MTKEKIQQLETDVSEMKTDVAVIKNTLGFMKEDSKSTKLLLKSFIGIGLTILTLVIVNIWSSAGDRKTQVLINESIQETLKHNSKVIGDMAEQGIEKGWYKPTKETYRNGGITENKRKSNR